jgi:hypothetical protein
MATWPEEPSSLTTSGAETCGGVVDSNRMSTGKLQQKLQQKHNNTTEAVPCVLNKLVVMFAMSNAR